MNTYLSSLRFRRLSALLALSMGVLAQGALADATGDRANTHRQDSVSASARDEAGPRAAAHEPRLVLADARLASDLRGRDIHNAQGEKIGSVHDLIIDLNSGRAPYVVVRSGGVLGMGGRDRAVPMGALKPRLADDGKHDGYTLNVSKELWEQAPTLERDRLTDLEAEPYGRNLHHVYGQVWPADLPVADTANPSSPGVNPPDRGRKKTGDADAKVKSKREVDRLARGQQLVLARKLTGKALVIRTNDREAGTIDEIVLAREGTRAEILLDPSAALSRDGRKYVVPFDRVIREGSGRYVTDLTTEDFLATAATESDGTSSESGAVRHWPVPGERARADGVGAPGMPL